MPEALAAYPPVSVDEQMLDMHVTDQIAYMEQRESHFTPVEAYEVGKVSLFQTVEVSESEIGARPPEAQAREVASEIWRSRSPFSQENAAIYGSEAERLQAVETVRGIANQARMTGKYFDGRHKRLGKMLNGGEITQDQHDEAVGEIVAGLSLTNPAHLRNVGEAQRASIDRRVKAGQLPEGTRFADVSSRLNERGEIELAGIDAVAARMTDAKSQAEFAQQGMKIKAGFYGEGALAKAQARHDLHQEKLREAEAAQFEMQVRRTIDMLDEEDVKSGKKAQS